MRIKGRKLETVNEEIIVIPRGNDEEIVLRARAVLDMSGFDDLCPRPEPPIITKRGGDKYRDVDDRGYKRQLDEYGSKRLAYMIIKSLEATEDLEWETVDVEDSGTWMNYDKELRNSGFSDTEIQRIIIGVMDANCLNDSKLDEAKKRFLRSQGDNHTLS